jgi:excisionase family DNA binding protein
LPLDWVQSTLRAKKAEQEGTPMAQTPMKRRRTASAPPLAAAALLPQATLTEVLTLTEAAAYLRVSEADVVRLVQQQDLPGRLIGTEWRFLKSALPNWLQTPPAPGSAEAVLSAAGAWKDDPHLEVELKEICQRRGRPMTVSGG